MHINYYWLLQLIFSSSLTCFYHKSNLSCQVKSINLEHILLPGLLWSSKDKRHTKRNDRRSEVSSWLLLTTSSTTGRKVYGINALPDGTVQKQSLGIFLGLSLALEDLLQDENYSHCPEFSFSTFMIALYLIYSLFNLFIFCL